MSRIFLSHSSKDSFEAIALSNWLSVEGWEDVFLDLDPGRGIAAGERWERSLHEAASRCQAVIFLVSRNWLASRWCLKEFWTARRLNKQLFAVLIDPAVSREELPPDLRDTWQVVNLSGGQDMQLFRALRPDTHEEQHVGFSRDGITRLKRGLQKAGLDPRFFAWPPENDPERVPYRGMKPLEATDAGIFFGRDAPIVEAADRLRGLATGASPRLMVILGASGAGKSSFLRAGLLPRLSRDDAHFVTMPPIRPGRAAISGDNGLLQSLEKACTTRTLGELRAAVKTGATAVRPILAELARQTFQRTLAEEGSSRLPTVVMSIDQTEELFQADGLEEGQELLSLVRDLTATDDLVSVLTIFAIRSDSYDALEHAKALEGLRQDPFALLPMPRGAYKEVIEGPARRVSEAGGKLAIEPQLTEQLLADIEAGGSSDALPLLAFTLEQLYLEYYRAGILRLADYKAIGGLGGAIDRAVERAFVRADANSRIPRDRGAREALLRRGLIPWLCGIDPDTRSPRRASARVSDIPVEAAPLINLLVEERLLSTDTQRSLDSLSHHEIRTATIEPTHEALLRQWGLLEGWLEEDFGFLVTLEGVQRAARDWDANARDHGWLTHGGSRLSEAHALDGRSDISVKLNATDRAYVAACREHEQAVRREADQRRIEREEEQSRRVIDAEALARGRKHIALVSLAAVMIAFALSTLALSQWTAASARSSEARQNQAAALAALSKTALNMNPAKALKLALAAWPRREGDFKKTVVALSALSVAIVVEKERRIIKAHEKAIESAAFSPDGTRVVTASYDNTARIWDAASGKILAVLKGHLGAVHSAAFSPDGARVVTASSDKTARIWDAASGEVLAVLRGHVGSVWSAAFSPDGTQVVTASQDQTARIWHIADLQVLAVLEGHEVNVLGAAFSPDGTRVVSASEDHTARIWDAASGQVLAVLKGYVGAAVLSAAFSPDGTRVVTASWDNRARVWDTASGQVLAVLEGHLGEVRSVAFSPDGKQVVTSSSDNTARLWDAASGQVLGVLSEHRNQVLSAAFSPDGTRVVTASGDHTARIWEAASGQVLAVLSGHEGEVFSAAFSSDGKQVVTASSDKTVRLWDAASGQVVAVLKGHRGQIRSAAFSLDGARVVTASRDDHTARIWDAASGQVLAVLEELSHSAGSAAFSPDGTHVVAASEDHAARIWDAVSGKVSAVLEGHEEGVNSAVFSPDGSRVVTASNDKTARIWATTSGKIVAVLKGHKDFVLSAAFSPDGKRVVTASSDNTAQIWESASGQVLGILRGHEGEVSSAAFSLDGRHVVTRSSDQTARVWDASSGKILAVLKGHKNTIQSVAFSPDGSRVVTASFDGTARIWDATSGYVLAVLEGHRSSVESASFSPDGTRIVTASQDNTARVWDTASGQVLAILKGHGYHVWNAVFSSNGKQVVTASADGTARIWNISTIPRGSVFEVACAWLPDHNLSNIVGEYSLNSLEPVCETNPPLPAPPAAE